MKVRKEHWNNTAVAAASLCLLAVPAAARADEGGVSFWLPGQMGSLAAVPGGPGWSLPVMYYHMDGDTDGSRQLPIGGTIAAGIEAGADLAFIAPTYTFAKPVLGGQMSMMMAWAYGDISVSADVTLTGPLGNVLRVNPHDSTTGSSDLYPQLNIKWNKGTSNYMAYLMGGIPVGSYQTGRLANVGINHASVDVGAGYTYLNPQTHWEYSSTIGLTYNFENDDTDYQNGVDSHLDLGVSYFLSPKTTIGAVGYAYYQLGGDSGSGATLGDFKSRVFAVGPQLGLFLGERRIYVNVKGYYEFEAKNRPEGWNAWVAVVVPLGPQKKD